MFAITRPDGRRFRIPTCWAEATLFHSYLLEVHRDVYNVLAILCKTSPENVMNWPASLLTPELLQAVAFTKEPLPFFPLLTAGKSVTLLGPTGTPFAVPLPASAWQVDSNQAADLGAVLSDTTAKAYEKNIRLLAIYLYPAYYGTAYDSEQLTAFLPLCEQAPLGEAMPLLQSFWAGPDRP